MDLTEVFPLGVVFPKGGTYHLLHWHCHDEQGHIALAQSAEAARVVFRRAYTKWNDARVRDFMRVELVRPPKEFCTKHAKGSFQQGLTDFWNHIACTLQVWKTPRPPPPEGVVYCTDHSNKKIANKDPNHDQCTACFRELRPVQGTLKSVYLEKREVFEKNFRRNHDAPTPSVARKLRDGEPLGAVLRQSNGGLTIRNPVSIDEFSFLHHPVLFFTPLETIDYGDLNFVVTQAEKEKQRVKALKDAGYEERRKVREQQARDELKVLFPPKETKP